jgi:hypothetical protein
MVKTGKRNQVRKTTIKAGITRRNIGEAIRAEPSADNTEFTPFSTVTTDTKAEPNLISLEKNEKETAKASSCGNDRKEVGVGENPTSGGCNGLPAADIPEKIAKQMIGQKGQTWPQKVRKAALLTYETGQKEERKRIAEALRKEATKINNRENPPYHADEWFAEQILGFADKIEKGGI